jgi:hypothetical protein
VSALASVELTSPTTTTRSAALPSTGSSPVITRAVCSAWVPDPTASENLKLGMPDPGRRPRHPRRCAACARVPTGIGRRGERPMMGADGRPRAHQVSTVVGVTGPPHRAARPSGRAGLHDGLMPVAVPEAKVASRARERWPIRTDPRTNAAPHHDRIDGSREPRCSAYQSPRALRALRCPMRACRADDAETGRARRRRNPTASPSPRVRVGMEERAHRMVPGRGPRRRPPTRRPRPRPTASAGPAAKPFVPVVPGRHPQAAVLLTHGDRRRAGATRHAEAVPHLRLVLTVHLDGVVRPGRAPVVPPRSPFVVAGA